MARRSAKATAAAKKQANLSDSNGEITAHERYPDVDKVLAAMFEARDQVTTWEEVRKDSLEASHEMLSEHKHEGPYYFDHAGSRYKIEIEHKDKLSIKKCKKGELENDEVAA